MNLGLVLFNRFEGKCFFVILFPGQEQREVALTEKTIVYFYKTN